MENRKGMMRTFLYENLRDLMLRNVFEKITIKQICDQTGVIRATFYNYFEDKYDCLNAIVYHDLVESAEQNHIDSFDDQKYLEIVLTNVDQNRSFYRVAYNVTGQNSFEDMVRANLTLVFRNYLNRQRKPGVMEKYDNDVVARYFGECLAFHVKNFVFRKDPSFGVKESKQMVVDFMAVSFQDFIQSK